ncbi:MAG: glycosyltransferase [Solirubrobacterales bacterium]
MIAPPDPRLRACVCIPAHQEQQLIGACIEALGATAGLGRDEWEVLIADDRCTDDTPLRARRAARRHAITLHVLRGGPGVGAARRLAMNIACERLHAVGRPRGLIACTDADTEVTPEWLSRQLDAIGAGAGAVAGCIDVHPRDHAALDPATLQVRVLRKERAMRRLHAGGWPAEHGFFGGASLGVTPEAYLAAGRLPPLRALEDVAFETALMEAGIRIDRTRAVRVVTSGRVQGRATKGLAAQLAEDEGLAPAEPVFGR